MRLAFLAVAASALLGAAPSQQTCSDLKSTNVAVGRTVLSSSTFNAARQAQGNQPALPEHCELLGNINDRTGTGGQHYAIKFHLRLPTNWNGRFFFEGGGGSNGNLGNALGNLQGGQRSNALTLGYAVVSQDSGHDNATNNDPAKGGTTTFGFDPQARIDFGYNSYDLVTQASKALVRTYYGKAPDKSYFVGCSEGGREAMLVSQRFPDYFDGVLACAPGFKLPKAALIGHAWDVQTFSEVSKATGINDKNGQPLINKTFSDEDLDLVSQAIVGACDQLDGLADGMILNFPACTSSLVGAKLAAVTCKGPKRSTCLTQAQVTAIQKVYAGAKDSKGNLLYSDWALDRGLGGKVGDNYNQGWRSWKLGSYDAPQNTAIITGLGAGAVASIFSTPPIAVASAGAAPMVHLMGIEPERDIARLYATGGEFTQSSWDFMMASSTDLSKFKAHGGRLVVVHGVSDPVFSVNDTISWWNDVNKANSGAASDFVRMFPVPGMNHCSGGPATDQYDAFGALVNWVEKGTTPSSILATAGTNTPWPGRTRPLCPYPSQPRYNGSGSIENAANFTCRLQ